MNERSIQKLLVSWLRQRRAPKATVGNIVWNDMWEADLIEINKSWEIAEYEIKCSKQDFKADFKKERKHKELSTLADLSILPNYFSYVCPEGMIEEADVPEYAGLYYIMESRNKLKKVPRVIIKPPILHNERVDYEKWRQIAIRLMWKIGNT